MPDLDTAKEREWIAACREDFEVGVSLQRAHRYLDAVDEARANYRFMVERAADSKLDGYRELGQRAAEAENQRDEHARTCARLREENTENEELLRQIREEIGAAWFADGVGVLEALRRKTRALERLLNGVALPGGGS